MKAYLCSVGELTTQICVDQLKLFGFDVILLDEIEPWYDKYKRFIFQTEEDCIRIDADVIPNKNIKLFQTSFLSMQQAHTYDYGGRDSRAMPERE